MKVSELIEYLKTQDPDLLVMEPGYEGGYYDIKPGDVKELVLDAPWYKGVWYYGPHDVPQSDEKELPLVKCLCL